MNRSVLEFIKLMKILYYNRRNFNDLKRGSFQIVFFLFCIVFYLHTKGYFIPDTSDRVRSICFIGFLLCRIRYDSQRGAPDCRLASMILHSNIAV